MSAFVTVLGAWGRYIVAENSDHFAYFLIPTVACALVQPFLVNGIAKHGCMWFGDNEVSELEH